MKLQIAFALLVSGIVTSVASAQQHDDKSSMADCPMMKDHATMNERGDKAMGFSHDKTTHHFILVADGGTIDVSANDSADQASRDSIRGHLGHIAKQFEQGNFQIPMLVHDKTPDGADVMRQQKGKISYQYEDTPAGGRVRIRTSDSAALQAVHAFLRFQITEHETGDPTEVAK